MGITVREMMSTLRSEEINTWFDLGLFIDRFKENRKTPSIQSPGSFEDFCAAIEKGGIAFITFEFGIDGVSLEVEKYAEAFRKILKDVPIYYIGGEFHSTIDGVIDSSTIRHELKEIKGFNKWPLYNDFFHIKLERGNEKYNELIGKFWNEVLITTEKLGKYIEENNIGLLYMINACSNPGNVALCLAIVFISEYLGIPVINNNHDFYWEEGSRKIDRILKRAEPGPRDHFFTNSDIGEFFSQIEVLFPWESRSWMNVNINFNQLRHVVETNGHNPANIDKIATAIDMEKFRKLMKCDRNTTLKQIAGLLSGYKDELEIHHPVEVLKRNLITEKSPRPILVGNPGTVSLDSLTNHIILLQPTRIITRKQIELNFILVKKLLNNDIFRKNFTDNPHQNLTVIVTGPIAVGHYNYILKLLKSFSELLETIEPEFRRRVFMGFLFSAFGKSEFKRRYGKYLDMPEIYHSASLVLLPSQTEGRGLPIIESAGCGVPVFCRRYHPENVYAETIGEHLEEKYRLQVLEFQGENITDEIVEEAAGRILFPQNYTDEIEHNQRAVQIRFGFAAIERNMQNILYKLYLQLQPNDFKPGELKGIIREYREACEFTNEDLRTLLHTDNRHYLPGYGRLSFMLMLKSLIDPSYFRAEEQLVRGLIMSFAREIVEENADRASLDIETLHRFYNAVDNIFSYREGEITTRHDHSLAYRHRNKIYYPYRDFTHQELMGLVNMLFHRIISSPKPSAFIEKVRIYADWESAIFLPSDKSNLGIDDREFLFERLNSNLPRAYFPGDCNRFAIELLILRPLRNMMKLGREEKVNEELLKYYIKSIPTVYIFCPEKICGKRLTADSLMNFLNSGNDPELSLLFKHGICRIIGTQQWCPGIHFPQLGEPALKALREIKKGNGFIITDDHEAAVMTDIVDIDRFHLGRVDREMTSNVMGIPLGSGYIQFAPAGVRTTLAYPTPIQTAKDFSDAIKSPEYMKLGEKIGDDELLDRIKRDAEISGSPIKAVLKNIESEGAAEDIQPPVVHSYLCGVYEDGCPWSGVAAKVKISQSSKSWKFSTITGEGKTKRVTSFVEDFRTKYGKNPLIAWNGGFILNAELVGKLGLPESYIGSPLGLIITDGRVISPPLFNKPAFLIRPDGGIEIKRVNCEEGIIISADNHHFELNPMCRNPKEPLPDEIHFYDLMHDEDKIRGDGRVIVRLAGDTIKEVIRTQENQDVSIIPVGLTLSFPQGRFPEEWDRIDKPLNLEMKGWDEIEHAIEAGPMLVDEGRNCIDMRVEGWKTQNSIRTQAARLDYTDMRGPKIAIGLDEAGDLSVLAINGRIRESVGATHVDMAEIMISLGIKKAMGFDPGGSSTLVVEGRELNISPYNSDYESDVYSLPPEPRAVANAVIGWRE